MNRSKLLMKELLDSYSRRARLQPAMITALPVGLVMLALAPGEGSTLGGLWTILAWTGATTLIANAVRDLGKEKELTLYKLWGGKPTTRLLRHRDAPNKALLARRHKRLSELLPSLSMPSAEDESVRPKESDEVYEACVAHLLERTRDKRKFELLFEENCNYGFRRNLVGLRPMGVTLSLLGSLAIGGSIASSVQARLPVSMLAVSSLVLCLLLLGGWVSWFGDRWVKAAADCYAERLLASCEELEVSPGAK